MDGLLRHPGIHSRRARIQRRKRNQRYRKILVNAETALTRLQHYRPEPIHIIGERVEQRD